MEMRHLSTSRKIYSQLSTKMLSKGILRFTFLLILSISLSDAYSNLMGPNPNYGVIIKDVNCTFNAEFLNDARCYQKRINQTANHGGVEFIIKPGIIIDNLFVSYLPQRQRNLEY